jgi:hypothetical protein
MIRAIGENNEGDVRAGANAGAIEVSVGDVKGNYKRVLLSVQDAFEFGRDLKELAERCAKAWATKPVA